MYPFFFGPYKDKISKQKFIEILGEANFGYSLKKVGLKSLSKTKWSLTYQRTILGTNENFKIECQLIKDTCRVYIDQKKWSTMYD